MRHSRRPSASRSPEFRQSGPAASGAHKPATPPSTAESAAPGRQKAPASQATAASASLAAAEGEIVVFRVRRDTACSECHEELGAGRFLRREGDAALCMTCADLATLEFLSRGNTALTRRARKYSTLHAVVVEWSRTRQRYERQGVLVEPDALTKAEQECQADTDVRMRQRLRAAIKRDAADEAFITSFVSAIQSAYPSCPAAEAAQIAVHACERSSGRVGRTAAGRALDPEPVRQAVTAHIRHTQTSYDRLLADLWDRRQARAEVHADVNAVLRQWSEPNQPGHPLSSKGGPDAQGP